MPREQLLGLAADVDRLLAAGATAAAGNDGLSRRGRTLRELGQKVAALVPVADAVERVTSGSPREVGRAFLDLMVMARQLRGSLAAAGVEGTLQSVEASGPWQTPTPTRDVYNAHDALTRTSSLASFSDAAERQVTGDLRLLPSALATLESGNFRLADMVADKVLPAVGRGVLPDLLAELELPNGKAPDARRLRAVCKIDPKIGGDLVRKGLTEGSPALKIQALECLPDVGRPGEAEKAGLEMWKEKKKDVRVAALRALRKATGDEALEVLMQALQEEDRHITQPVQEVLAELPHPKATERLLREVEQRLAALPPPMPKPKKDAKKDTVKAAEKAEKARTEAIAILCRVVEALGDRKETNSQPVLKALLDLTHHADESIRLRAVQALAKLGPEVKGVVPALTEAVGDANSAVTQAAVDALSGFPSDKRATAIPTLLERAADPKSNEQVVYRIVSMLPGHMSRFGDKILALMHSLLKGKNDFLYGGVLYALCEIGTAARKLLPEVLESIKTRQRGWEFEFDELFVKIEPEGTTVIPALIELLKERKAHVRGGALKGLEGYGPKAQAAEPLVAKLRNDRDLLVMARAGLTLAAIKGEG